MNLEKERELFLQWHYNTFLLENPNIDINNAQYIYDYSHIHEMVRNIRENNFAVWLASASREGYKMVPVEPTFDMYEAFYTEHDKYEDCDVTPFKNSYKAMFGVVE